jgi:hypothetical protein
MVWREQQQQQAGSSSSSSSSGSSDYAQAASGVLGAQLLNPLWTKVVLTLPHQQQQQQQQLVLYHSPSHGFVSLQRPAAYVGPAGGMLCDEMGERMDKAPVSCALLQDMLSSCIIL